MTAPTPVTLLFNGHDVAVVAVDPSKTSVGRGYNVSIAATVKDFGIYNETVTVVIYLGTVENATQSINLASASSVMVSYKWNTTGFAYGNYTPSAYALAVQGETNTGNNNYTASANVTVTIPGDFNGDFKVNLSDLVILANAYGTTPASPHGTGSHQWNPNVDTGAVNLADLVILATHYGEHYP
jgi:hypothetical protein